MNILKQEWKSTMRATLFWSIGILVLLSISFYEMNGISAMSGGFQAFMDTLPSFFQIFFAGYGVESSALGIYRMIHMYLMVALALHAVLLGAGIFTKEVRDKTCEFLYVKGITRIKILNLKIVSGIATLLLLDGVCLLGVGISTNIVGLQFSMVALLPYMGALLLLQLFFFILALWLSLLHITSRRSSGIGCGIVMFMLLINVYAKFDSRLQWLDLLSIFHYTDTSFLQAHTTFPSSWIWLLLLVLCGWLSSQYLHTHRDLV